MDALTTRWWKLNASCTTGQDNFRSLNSETMGELYLMFAVFMATGVLLLIGELLLGNVIMPRLQKRRQRQEAKRARRERRYRRAQARLAGKSAVALEENQPRDNEVQKTD